MRIRPKALLATVAAALVSVGVIALAAGAGTTPASGVRGVVKVPVSGSCLADDPCDGVGRGIKLVFWQNGPGRRVSSNAQGTFQLRLARGRYHVRAVVTPAQPVSPVTVLVPAKGFVRVTFVVGAEKHVVPPPPPPPVQR